MSRARRAGAALGAIGLLLAAETALGATLYGVVTGGPAASPLVESDLYGKYRREGRDNSVPAPNPLIILLEPQNAPVPPPAPGQRAVIDQRDEQFTPRALPVRAGTIVDFVNSDEFYHNVFSLSPAHKFNLGRYRRGLSRSVEFDRPGLVKLFCDIHPRMIGYVLAVETPWFGSATPAGDFVIESVPPGRYNVMIWHERLKEPARLTEWVVGAEPRQRFDLAIPAAP